MCTHIHVEDEPSTLQILYKNAVYYKLLFSHSTVHAAHVCYIHAYMHDPAVEGLVVRYV